MIKIKNAHGLIELKCESSAEKTCTPKGQGKWTMGEPVAGVLVKSFLISVLYEYPGQPIDLTIETPEKVQSLLTEYGLSESQRSRPEASFVELTLAGEKGAPDTRLTEWFGDDFPIQDSAYVGSGVDGKMNEQKVFLLNKRLKILTLGKTTADFLPSPSAN